MRTRMFMIAAAVSFAAVGCLIDFGGYETAPDASVGASDGGGVGGASGAAGESSGGTAGAGGMSGNGGSQAGSGGSQAGSGGAQGGSGGAATGGAGGGAGSGGLAGEGGSACAFDACEIGSVPPSGCSGCTTAVCQTLPFCCNDTWSYECTIEARAVNACGCAAAECSNDLPTPGAGSCATGGSCNPVTGKGCGTGQCVLDLTSGQPKYQCQLVGTLGACESCEPTLSKNCAAGLSCIANRCVRVCCDQGDCPQGTSCKTGILPGTVGLCTAQ